MTRFGLGGLSRPIQLFLLVDLLLVLVLVVLVATRPERDDRGASAAPTSTAAQAAPDAGDGTPPVPTADAERFALPSGNIACEVSSAGVLCSIGTFTYAPPTVTGCEGATGHVVSLDADGFRFVCEDDGEQRVAPGAPELPYGQRRTVGDYTCASGTDGVTCTDAAGVGFRLARAQWTALP